MAEMYCKLIKDGRRTLEQVPAKYRAEVQALIEQTP
ncbi:CD1375 family protein [Desulfosporosinus lacus]|nr:CD1375 family protein [Desulfosporosinus lacus]